MKSEELYRLLRLRLAPWYRAAQFRRAPRSPLGWYKLVDGEAHLAWAHCSKWGWDPYSGSSFFFSFQVSPEPVPWAGRAERLQWFLSDDELQTAQRLQNRVIAALPGPPPEHVDMLRAAFAKSSPRPEELMEAYLADFQPVAVPFRRTHDLALRYYSPADVDAWAAFILAVLPRVHVDLPTRLGTRA